MTMPAQRRGFTLIEVLLLMTMASILVAISVPRFFQAQKNARTSEAITELKRLHVGMSTQQRKPTSIHVPGPQVQRGNRYSYHLALQCSAFEDRSTRKASSHPNDDCIGVDTFANPTLPSLFAPVVIGGVVWGDAAPGLAAFPGIFGSETDWDYFAMAAGDADGNLNERFTDTWGISSATAEDLYPLCPMGPLHVPAGEPFQVYDDTQNCF